MKETIRKKRYSRFSILAGVLTALLVSTIASAAYAAGPSLPPLGSVQKNIPYCNGQTADVYQPRVRKYTKAPAVIYIHGGGLYSGSKTSDVRQLQMLDGLRNQGFMGASIDYRLLPRHNSPAQIQDVLCAVRALKANAVALGADPNRIALVGFSAGGYLAGLAGTLPGNNEFNKGAYPGVSSSVKAVVGIGGVYDLNYELRNGLSLRGTQAIYGSYNNSKQSPMAQASAGDPPFLLIHGQNDRTVRREQSDIFAKRLTAVKVPHQLVRVNGAGHGLEPSPGPLAPSQMQVNNTIHKFLISKLGL